MINRKEILEEAVHRCLRDMYLWSQPSIDIDELLKTGYKDTEESPLYRKHYLSSKNFVYLKDTYINAYRMEDDWENDFETLINYLYSGGLKSKYIKEEGCPGYKGYEKVPSIYKYLDKEDADIVMSLIGECKDFYRVNKEANDFSFTMALGVGSPTSNAKEVEEYWQDNNRPNFTIKDFYIEDILYGTEENDYEPEMSEEDFINTLK